ncbi:acyltransferase [Paractinoplanes toevensis]|uniref:Acyltransferase n=2 Tax=Paractinoplanes toevensis TaxID=571911 RepID=A0A919W9Q1_9ACTN|nr:acyltransferase [Actinoplanes toevensis]
MPRPVTDGQPRHQKDRQPRSAGPANDGRRRLPALDGLRYLAALSVAVFHLVAGGEDGLVNLWGRPGADVFGVGYLIASYGWVGVPLFFMISGFVICMSSWNRSPAEYAVSRFVRLYPAFWACVLLTTLVTILHPDVFHPVGFRALLANLTMLQDPLGTPRVDDVYWTLWLELKFYLLFLVVLRRGTTYRRVVGFCLAWTIASVLATEVHQPWLDALLIRGNSQYFIAGIALYLIHRYGSRPVLWTLVGSSWALSMYYYAGNPWQTVHGHSYAPSSALITACFVVLALLALGKLDRLRWRVLTVLGTATYPLYLLHRVAGFTIVHALRQHLTASPVVLLAGLLVALTGVALLIHHLVERPLAPRLKAALTRSRHAVGAVPRPQPSPGSWGP